MGVEHFSGKRVFGRASNPGEAELAELRHLNERFSGHHIFWEFTARLKVRYLAYAMSHGVRPHTIITQDLAEIRDELEQANPQQLILRRLGCQGYGGCLRPPHLEARLVSSDRSERVA